MADRDWRLVADDLCCIDVDSQREAASLAEALRDTGEWTDVVVGRSMVCTQFDLARLSADRALSILAAFEVESASQAATPGHVDIPACYDPAVAPDLVATCERLGLSREAFVRAHAGATHEVAMLGFMPGFAYIDGLDASLQVDRLDQPRQHVAAGSIGIAGRQTGIYPFDGPGGWRLIARTPMRLFDPAATPPALLKPLQTVRFVPLSLHEFEAMS